MVSNSANFVGGGLLFSNSSGNPGISPVNNFTASRHSVALTNAASLPLTKTNTSAVSGGTAASLTNKP